MGTKPILEFWTVYEEAEPWAVFCQGHVHRGQFTRADVAAAMHRCSDYDARDIADQLPAGRMKFQHLWMSQFDGDEGDDPELQPDEESGWYWCPTSATGA